MARSLTRHRTRLRLGAAVAAAALPLAGLTACTEDEPEPKIPSSPTAEPSEPESSETSDEPVEPQPPAAMDKANEAGAKAFVEYYWQLLDYAALTGDTEALDKVAIDGCAACRGYSESVQEVYEAGGDASGGQATLSSIEVNARGLLPQGVKPFEAVMNVEVSALRIRGTGNPKLDGTVKAFKGEMQVQLSHGRTGWRMSEWTQV